MSLQFHDLAELDAPISGQGGGTPMLLPLDSIDEDPEQPRREFDAEALQELADTIRERGVRQPVSVRPHPEQPGRWMLNFGARRLRASQRRRADRDPSLRRCECRQLRPSDRERAARRIEAVGTGAVREEAPGARRDSGRHRAQDGKEPGLRYLCDRADRCRLTGCWSSTGKGAAVSCTCCTSCAACTGEHPQYIEAWAADRAAHHAPRRGGPARRTRKATLPESARPGHRPMHGDDGRQGPSRANAAPTQAGIACAAAPAALPPQQGRLAASSSSRKTASYELLLFCSACRPGNVYVRPLQGGDAPGACAPTR